MKLIDIEEVQKVLGCSKSTIYRWTSKGQIPYRKINGLLRFEEAEINSFFEGNRAEFKK